MILTPFPISVSFWPGRLESLVCSILLEQTIARRRPGLVVLTHHRIAEPETDSFYSPVISATPDALRAQVTWLNDRVRMITLNELDRSGRGRIALARARDAVNLRRRLPR